MPPLTRKPTTPTAPQVSNADTKPLVFRLANASGLLRLIVPVPLDWVTVGSNTHNSNGAGGLTYKIMPAYCDSYAVLVDSWKKAVHWTDGWDYALSVMLASITSTMSVGSQLWVKVLGPASCGKSTLCEALSVAEKYVYPVSTMRGFHTGVSDESGEDYSLLSKCGGKTLVTKDGDTLLQSPNLEQILSEGRDVYDTNSRTSYRTKQGGRSYVGIRLTWILCGTASLRKIDSSELGERFLDCVMMEEIDDDLEDQILWRVASRAERNMAIISDGSVETQQSPEMIKAMQLTGGYIEYLRENCMELMMGVQMEQKQIHFCTRIGKYVAHMRARPSRVQDEEVQREFAARLVEQHIRAAKCLAAVLGRKTVDGEVIRRVKKLGTDTGRGFSQNVADQLYKNRENGMMVEEVAAWIDKSPQATHSVLRFMRTLKIVQPYHTVTHGVRSKTKWQLTPRMLKLYEEVHQ